MADNQESPEFNIYNDIMDDVEYIAEYKLNDDIIMEDDQDIIEIDPPR